MDINKSSLLLGSIAIISSLNIHAAGNYYINVGGGGVFPSNNSSFTQNSSSVLYSPTAIGTSLFTLPNVNWKNAYNTGYEANIAFGYYIAPHWRSDIEFLYQNMRRNINGTYGWLEQYAATGATYAATTNNPINQTSSTANVYSFLINGYYDFKNNTKWTPLVGAGIGIAWLNASSTTTNNILNIDDPNTPLIETAPASQKSPSLTGNALAGQIKLGIAYAVNNTTSVTLLYRLFATTPFKASSSTITTNPGTTGQTTFYINSHSISGLLNNMLELDVKFDT